MTTEIQEEVLSQKDQLSERLEPAVGLLSFAERRAEGKARRDIVSRKSHAVWDPHCRQVDPVAILEQSNEGRIQELVPMRYGRMLKSPFAFFRGSAALMAADLARTPVTGMRVQACGDCHLLNFGADRKSVV